MTLVVYLAIYAGLLIFLAGSLRRILQYSRLPLHLRWELYPVPHEAPERAKHGGSYFESSDWWTKPHQRNLAGELRVMLPEMLFLKALWEFNRPLWYLSFLFHFGLYMSIGAAVLLGARAAIPSSLAPAWILMALLQVAHAAGFAGAAFVITGALGLLYRRMNSADLKNYTTGADLFNLVLFIVTFAALGIGYALRPAGVEAARIARGLLTFDTGVPVGTVFGAGLILAAAAAAYIPFTHMAHFIAKYFTYHAVRWDDRVNLRGEPMEATLGTYLAYRPTWAALHIAADGKKTWVDIVTSSSAQEVRK